MMQTQNESGRSLVEMLAVVSVMGVLVVGAMSALRFGTTSMQVSSTYNLIENAAAGVADLYSWSRSYPAAGEAKTMAERIARSGDIIEGCRYDGGQCEGCECTSQGLKVEIPWGENGDNKMIVRPKSDEYFEIELPSIPKDICQRLIHMDWSYAIWASPADCSTEKGSENVDGITFRVY